MKEMQIKTTLKFHLTPVRIFWLSTRNKQKVLARMWGKTNSYTAGGNVI
jgi:hypothetical protein